MAFVKFNMKPNTRHDVKLEYERERRLVLAQRFKELRRVLTEAGFEKSGSSNQAAILGAAIRFVCQTMEKNKSDTPLPSPEAEMSYHQSPEVTAFFAQ